jgi:hypothetical protein
MKVLTEERIKTLAEKNGWSLTRAEGYLDGENSRRLGIMPSSYVQVGIDDYCAGFRTGYYERDDAASKTRDLLAARL